MGEVISAGMKREMVASASQTSVNMSPSRNRITSAPLRCTHCRANGRAVTGSDTLVANGADIASEPLTRMKSNHSGEAIQKMSEQLALLGPETVRFTM